jgi:HlyD family secretion protein
MKADQARADVKARDALVRAAVANVKKAQVDLEHTVIRSPIDGIVVKRDVDAGQTVTATLQSPVLFTIADLAKMDLLTEVSEGEVGAVRPGSRVSFRVESLGATTFEGTVASVRLQPYAEATTAVATSGTPGTTATGTTGTSSATSSSSANSAAGPQSGNTGTGNPASPSGGTSGTPPPGGASTTSSPARTTSGNSGGPVTYTAVVNVDNADGRLTPGATAIVTITGDTRRQVLRVPNAALAFRPSAELLERTGQSALTSALPEGQSGADRGRGVRYVWRFENQRFSPVEVRIGLSDSQWSEVLGGGVEPGDQFVTAATRR